MSEFTRRTVVRGAAWSVPVIAVVAPIPAFATSLRKDPGINGWVLISTTDRDFNSYDLRFDSDEAGTGPDGAPYGLYVYDPNRTGNVVNDVYTNASITLWIRTDTDSTPANNGWSRTGSGPGWQAPVDVGVQTKPDNLQYRGYQFSYTGTYTLVAAEERVYLQDFVASSNNIAEPGRDVLDRASDHRQRHGADVPAAQRRPRPDRQRIPGPATCSVRRHDCLGLRRRFARLSGRAGPPPPNGGEPASTGHPRVRRRRLIHVRTSPDEPPTSPA